MIENQFYDLTNQIFLIYLKIEIDHQGLKRLEKKLATADKAAELNRSAGALFFAARGSKEKIRLLNSVWTTLDAKRRRAALYMFYFNRDILRNVQKYSPPLARNKPTSM